MVAAAARSPLRYACLETFDEDILDTIAPAVPGPPAPAPRSGWRRLFVGDDGLRAGWSVALYLALLVLAGLGFMQLLGLLGLRGRQANAIVDAWFFVKQSGAFLLIVVVALALLKLIERRPWSAYGVTFGRAAPRFAQGALVGVIALSLLAGTLILLGGLAFDGVGVTVAPAVQSALSWLLAYLIVGVFEELLFRGVLFHIIRRGMGVRWAAVISSLAFLFAHIGNPGEAPFGLIGAGLIALVFCYSVWKTGSLWWAIGVHTAWNWSQSYLFGVANSGFASRDSLLITHAQGAAWLSGGETGPEGSVLIVVTVGAMAAVLWRMRRSAS
ncbi:CPBP family intramembrane metalloprotease [soil metagenome]